MPKFSVMVRNLWMSELFKNHFESKRIVVGEVAPGQLWTKGDWYGLTILRTYKYKKFNPIQWEDDDQTVDSIRSVKFSCIENKLLVLGGKSDINQIDLYFKALIVELDDAPDLNFNDYYRLDEPIVDLSLLLTKYEEKQQVQNISKIRVKKLEVTLGQINNCAVITENYDTVRKAVIEPESTIVGIEIQFRDKVKTSVFYDINGVVRVTSKSPDVNVEELTVESVSLL